MTSKIIEAKNTCEGLQHLIRRLNGAAVDLDKGGESAHELLALLASTNECVNTLNSQLQELGSDDKVTAISPQLDVVKEPLATKIRA